MLRYWREARGVSQLDLSLETGVSQRHLSFIESGRSVPGRETLTIIVQALDIPLRERNAVFLAAGYAPVYSEAPWNAQEMRSIAHALERILRQHDPFPAFVMDRHWNVLMTNESAPRFFNCFIDMAARTGPRNVLHLMFDPDGMRPFVADWKRVAGSLIQRVHREAVGRVIDDDTRALLDALRAYPDVADVDASWISGEPAGSAPTFPVIPIGFRHEGNVLNYFSMITSVAAPHGVAAQELRIESMFPADEETEARHMALLGAFQTSAG
nr:helix-turn-helix transcriptional regulator [Trinickia terrae]